MKKFLIVIGFPIVFLGVGTLLVHSLEILSHFPYKYATGTVTNVVQGKKSNQVTLTVIFQTENKDSVYIKSNNLMDLKDLPSSRVGQKVRVYYSPAYPLKAFVNEGTIAFSLFFFIVGLLALSMFIKFVIDYFTPIYKIETIQNTYIFKRKGIVTLLDLFDKVFGVIIGFCSFFVFGDTFIWFLQNPDFTLLKNQSFTFYLSLAGGIIAVFLILKMLFKSPFSKKINKFVDISKKAIYLKNKSILFKDLKKIVISPTHINMSKKNDPDGFGLYLITMSEGFLFLDSHFERNVEHYALLINQLLGNMQVTVEKQK
ncbi:MAG: DUF3592 domain-containing protein [Thermoflexibacter sp.]|jgi:hypothetical protein|nr:DUF3592 domain-containing protein [Thermoflexibacter sp.]